MSQSVNNTTSYRAQGLIVAVDGPAAAGKGTLCKALAKEYRMKFLDTGTLYRTVAYRLTQTGYDIANVAAAEKIAHTMVDHYDFKHLGNNQFGVLWDEEEITSHLRAEQVGSMASSIAQEAAVRQAVVKFTRDFATRWQTRTGVVIDGQDGGTYVFPTAPVKIFIDATAEERANRRFKDEQKRDSDRSYDDILKAIKARDARDRNRPVGALKAADGATVIDTTHLDAPSVFKVANQAVLNVI